MNRTALIKKLNDTYHVEATLADEFYGRTSDGIWIRDEGKVGTQEMPAFDYNANEYDPTEESYRMGVAIEVEDMLDDAGWYAEPHDAGTWMIWPQ